MKHPLVKITLAFCLGIVIASKIRLYFFLIYIFVLIFLILCAFCIKKEKIFHILLFCLSFLLGVLLLVNSYILPKNHLVKLASVKGQDVFLEGMIDSDPVEQFNKTSFVLKAEKLKIGDYWYKVCGKALVKAADKKGLFYGDRLILEGKFYKPFYFPVSGKISYRDYLKAKGLYVILSVKKHHSLKLIKSQQGNRLVYCLYRIRERLRDIVSKNLSKLNGAILSAVILGLRQDLPKQTRDILVNTGTVHIIAISGLHLGIVAFMVLIFLKLIRLSRRPRYIIAIFILFLYCILTGSSVPVVRATIMATIFLLGYTIRRQPDISNCLSLAGLIILFINPGQLFQISFQLSFLSVVSLVWLSPRINSLFPESFKKSKYLKLLINLFSASLASWLGLAPFIIYYFKVISPITILANMVVVPYMTLIIACGFSFLLVGLFFPYLLALFSPATEISTSFLLKFLSLLNHIPLGHFLLP